MQHDLQSSLWNPHLITGTSHVSKKEDIISFFILSTEPSVPLQILWEWKKSLAKKKKVEESEFLSPQVHYAD